MDLTCLGLANVCAMFVVHLICSIVVHLLNFTTYYVWIFSDLVAQPARNNICIIYL